MNYFIKLLGTFIPANQLDKIQFVTTKAERDAKAAEVEAFYASIENGAGFGAWLHN